MKSTDFVLLGKRNCRTSPVSRSLFILVFFLFTFSISFSQNADPFKPYRTEDRLLSRGYFSLYQKSDSEYIVLGLCKNFGVVIPKSDTSLLRFLQKENILLQKPSLLRISGNIRYDFLYRSFLDTPFAQKNLRQHTVQTTLNFLWKEKYPFQIKFTSRQSNSPFFRNYLDVGFEFDKYNYNRKIKEELFQQIVLQSPLFRELNLLKESRQELLDAYTKLNKQLNNVDPLQRLVEHREESLRITLPNKIPQRDIITKDSLKGITFDVPNMQNHNQDSTLRKKVRKISSKFSEFKDEKRKLEKLKDQINEVNHKIDSLKERGDEIVNNLKGLINNAQNSSDLRRIASANNLNIQRKKDFQERLLDFQKIGIGRTMLNYTELTIWDVSLTGINMEYHPSRLYAALAAGKVDYGFRDFLGKSLRTPGQNLIIGRIGYKQNENTAIIFSLFRGKKYNYGSSLYDSIQNYVPLMGYSIETIIGKTVNKSLSFEIAKSTRPTTGRFSNNHELPSLVNFSDKTNLAINLKGQYLVGQSKTILTGYFRKNGRNFQSFSLYSFSTDQIAWSAKMVQPFWDNKADISLMLRKNDFTNPFTDKTFKTSTVFKSGQLNLRIPKWPAISIGYYPGSQVYVVDKQKFNENIYYILNGSALYSYAIRKVNTISSFVFSRYYNQNTDSGFIAYKGVSYILSQNFFSKFMQVQFGYNYTNQPFLKYSTLETGIDYFPTSNFSIGAGFKKSKTSYQKIYLGGRINALIILKGLGSLQVQYEKSYLPTIHHKLYPLEVGRISWFKTF